MKGKKRETYKRPDKIIIYVGYHPPITTKKGNNMNKQKLFVKIRADP